MAELKDFICIRQTTDHGCWIACAVMIWNYMNNIKTTVHQVKKEFEIKEDAQGSPAELLGKMYGLENGEYIDCFPMDQYAVPKFEEIKGEFQKDDAENPPRPILCCVGSEQPYQETGPGDSQRFKKQEKVKAGHWIIIIGLEEDKLIIVEPWDGAKHTVVYNSLYYVRSINEKYYWQNSSYVRI
ncbi:hypothetical protein [Luxibacter massiliensis]|uniref:hypothetical protein n=1 Tax=Luxibacter massiliensis TaxID=2219695 RepID=UPI000F065BC0|nr:hypothetical protein [Luxibacter massiliensis]